MLKTICFGFLILLYFAGNLHATSYYVSTASSGSASGNSWTNKQFYKSFNWPKLAGGDTVFFDGGTDSLTYAPITLSGQSWDAGQLYYVNRFASQVVITKGKESGHNGKAIFQNNDTYLTSGIIRSFFLNRTRNIKLTGLTFNTIATTDNPAVWAGIVGVSLSSNITIDKCSIISNGIGTCLRISADTNVTLTNNYVEVLPNAYISDADCIYFNGAGSIGREAVVMGNTIINSREDNGLHPDLIQLGDWGSTDKPQFLVANNFMSCPDTANKLMVGINASGETANRFLIYNNVISLKGLSNVGSGEHGSSAITMFNVNPAQKSSMRLYNNTIITKRGFLAQFDLLDTLIMKNNIFYSDTNLGNPLTYFPSGLINISVKDIDYNQYYKPTGYYQGAFNMTDGSTIVYLKSWKTLGYDINGDTGAVSFVNKWGTSAVDYRLSPGSDGIDKGTTIALTVVAIDGTIRPQGAAYDLGAFETGVSVTPTTYYVASNGNDANTGTSILSPWKTISKVNSKSVNPGDIILFRRGDTWSELLTPTSSGNSSSPIIYDCYGSGNLPIIDGGSVRNNCISINGVSYVTIRNFRVQNSVVNSNGNIHAINTNNLRIESCEFYITSHGGINIESSSNAYIGFCSMSSPVSNNNNQADGIYSQKNSNCIFENNNIIISDMGTAQNEGIQSYLDANMTLRNNYIFQNNTLLQVQGIDILDGNGTFNVYNNVIKCPNSNGNILGFNNDVSGTAALRCYQNTVLGNLNCLRILKCSDYIVQNNIFYSNSATSIIDIGVAPTSNSAIDYNLYNRSGSGSIINFEPQGYKTYAQWQAMGYEFHGINANPVVNDTLCPATTSPVINAGTNLSSTFSLDKDGNLRPLNGVDLGAYEIKSALPVELTTFTGNYVDNSVRINWSTATEVNNQGFDIERNSSTTWEKIGFVQGKGNSVIKNDYSFEDKNPVGYSIQYRLKQIDNNGKFKYSDVVEIAAVPQSFSIGNYPNPFNPSTKIRYTIPIESMTKIEIYNLLGEKIEELKNEIQQPGIYELNWNAGNHPSGIYLLSINESPVNGAARNSKVIKMSLIK